MTFGSKSGGFLSAGWWLKRNLASGAISFGFSVPGHEIVKDSNSAKITGRLGAKNPLGLPVVSRHCLLHTNTFTHQQFIDSSALP